MITGNDRTAQKTGRVQRVMENGRVFRVSHHHSGGRPRDYLLWLEESTMRLLYAKAAAYRPGKKASGVGEFAVACA
jgi:hypothetical protein